VYSGFWNGWVVIFKKKEKIKISFPSQVKSQKKKAECTWPVGDNKNVKEKKKSPR
jgi:hypothetical protein